MSKLKEYYEDVIRKPNNLDPESDKLENEKVETFMREHEGKSFESVSTNQAELKKLIESLGTGKNIGISNENLIYTESPSLNILLE